MIDCFIYFNVDSLHFNRILIVLYQIHYGGMESQNYDKSNCMTVSIRMDLFECTASLLCWGRAGWCHPVIDMLCLTDMLLHLTDLSVESIGGCEPAGVLFGQREPK